MICVGAGGSAGLQLDGQRGAGWLSLDHGRLATRFQRAGFPTRSFGLIRWAGGRPHRSPPSPSADFLEDGGPRAPAPAATEQWATEAATRHDGAS